jgi:hypothetical protein
MDYRQCFICSSFILYVALRSAWNINYGPRIIGYGLWVMDYGLWIMNCEL